MGRILTLLEVVQRLWTLNDELTIYAAKPWTPDSAAMLAEQEGPQGYSTGPATAGMRYFMEVYIAQDFLKGYLQDLMIKPPAREQCERLIRYAIDDA